MPTEELEHELRRAFAKAAAGYQHPELARERLLRRNYRPGSGHRRLATGITAVAAAGAVVLGLGLSAALGSAQAGGGVSPAHSLRARLLAAIDAARGDILSAQGQPSGPGQHGGSGQTLTYPWYPRPGQQVRIHTRGWGADGKLFQDFESIFTMPAGHGTSAMNPVNGNADLTITGTYFQVCPVRHTWGKWQHNTQIIGLSADAAGLRHQLATGQFKIIRRGVVDGRKAIELGLTGLNRRMTGLHATAARLWVDAASYLPLQQILQFSTGRVYITDYGFLLPTPANLAKLHPVIPAGYHRTTLLPCRPPYK